MKKFVLITAVLFMVLFSEGVHAGSILTITNVVNVNGSIGLYIKNEVGTTMYTNNADYNKSVLTYYVDDEPASINASQSVAYIPPYTEKLVILKKAWPSTGYSSINVSFTDESGTSYTKEWSYAFAKQGLTLKEFRTNPVLVTINSSLTATFVLSALGEDNISEITASVISNPQYFGYDTQIIPAYMKKGEEKEFVFKFKETGGGMPDTVIYSTSYLPVKITYKYFGFKTTLNLNESIIVYNPNKVGANLPVMNLKMSVPSKVQQGTSANVSVYAWNSNIGGNAACDLNLTLNASSSSIKIPIYNILPGIVFNGTVDEPYEPIAVFSINVTNSTPLGIYTLNLKASYNDCEWKSPHKLGREATFNVLEFVNATKTPEVIVVEEEPGAVAENVSINETTTEVQKAPKNYTLLFYIILGLVAAGIVFAVIYTLIKRSQRI